MQHTFCTISKIEALQGGKNLHVYPRVYKGDERAAYGRLEEGVGKTFKLMPGSYRLEVKGPDRRIMKRKGIGIQSVQTMSVATSALSLVGVEIPHDRPRALDLLPFLLLPIDESSGKSRKELGCRLQPPVQTNSNALAGAKGSSKQLAYLQDGYDLRCAGNERVPLCFPYMERIIFISSRSHR